MQRHSWTDSGEEVHLARIAELFFGCSCCCRLNEFPEASACIGESPGRKLDAKCFQRRKNLLTPGRVHANLSLRNGRLHSMPRVVTDFFRELGRFALRNSHVLSTQVKIVRVLTHGVKLVSVWHK